jgi:hypothetical protein
MNTPRNVIDAATDTVARAADLIQLEFRLARAELAEKALALRSGLAFIAAGAVFMAGALFLLLQAAVVGLIEAGVSPTLATLIVAVACIAAGFALIASGRSRLDSDALTPERTVRQISRDTAMVKEKLT